MPCVFYVGITYALIFTVFVDDMLEISQPGGTGLRIFIIFKAVRITVFKNGVIA